MSDWFITWSLAYKRHGVWKVRSCVPMRGFPKVDIAAPTPNPIDRILWPTTFTPLHDLAFISATYTVTDSPQKDVMLTNPHSPMSIEHYYLRAYHLPFNGIHAELSQLSSPIRWLLLQPSSRTRFGSLCVHGSGEEHSERLPNQQFHYS